MRYFVLKRYISDRIDWIVLVFENLYGKIVIDDIQNFRRPNIFRPE